jgi:GNAT superfamily N-acetyltransferase
MPDLALKQPRHLARPNTGGHINRKGDKIKITVHFEAENVTSSEIAELYEYAGFGAARDYLATDDFRDRFIGGSSIFTAFATTPTSHLTGMIRAFTDNTFVTYIAEICVAPEFQRQGIGKALVKAVVDRFQHTAIFADVFNGHEQPFIGAGITPKSKLIACSRAPGPVNNERA